LEKAWQRRSGALCRVARVKSHTTVHITGSEAS
jgi:hypothetical protein